MPRFVSRLPGDVRQLLGIGAGERVLAWGSGPGGESSDVSFAAATQRALYLQSGDERLPWDRIGKATWDESVLELTILDASERPVRQLRVPLTDARGLPAAVRDRVTASVVISETVDLGGGAGALMVARRGSDDDVIRWSVVFDPGLDPGDPVLQRAAADALARLRDALGV
jgi:hypothetical protein